MLKVGAVLNSKRLSLAAGVTTVCLLTLSGVSCAANAPSVASSSTVHSNTVVNPKVAGLSKDQVLQQLIAPPQVRGFVWGVLGESSKVVAITLPGDQRASLFTDYPLRVLNFVGPGQAPYLVGSTITVRVPGGTTSSERVTFEDAPQVAAGDTVFVLDRDQGQLGGGNTATVLVASRGSDVFELRNGYVVGQGDFSGLSEPLAVFLAHFPH
jgi:hypothetical protein